MASRPAEMHATPPMICQAGPAWMTLMGRDLIATGTTAAATGAGHEGTSSRGMATGCPVSPSAFNYSSIPLSASSRGPSSVPAPVVTEAAGSIGAVADAGICGMPTGLAGAVASTSVHVGGVRAGAQVSDRGSSVHSLARPETGRVAATMSRTAMQCVGDERRTRGWLTASAV